MELSLFILKVRINLSPTWYRPLFFFGGDYQWPGLENVGRFF
jgi:hypothetical protein